MNKILKDEIFEIFKDLKILKKKVDKIIISNFIFPNSKIKINL